MRKVHFNVDVLLTTNLTFNTLEETVEYLSHRACSGAPLCSSICKQSITETLCLLFEGHGTNLSTLTPSFVCDGCGTAL